MTITTVGNVDRNCAGDRVYRDTGRGPGGSGSRSVYSPHIVCKRSVIYCSKSGSRRPFLHRLLWESPTKTPELTPSFLVRVRRPPPREDTPPDCDRGPQTLGPPAILGRPPLSSGPQRDPTDPCRSLSSKPTNLGTYPWSSPGLKTGDWSEGCYRGFRNGTPGGVRGDEWKEGVEY